MPPKITSKNLSYDNSAPPFLAALRAQAAGATGPDPLLAAQRRSAKKRSSSEEAEDVPLVVDEDGNVVVNLEVDKDGTVKESANYPLDSSSAEKEPTKEPESKAAIGGRKRKVGKVIGEAAEEPAADKETEGKKEKKHGDADKEAVKNRKPKKKAKKIKLSFDEDEG
ncbi:hypothetical protein CDV36_009027 [Fusarium kuroshium]|uniref:DUF4604 domain-containing protein n=1 Tax=Fusarium kuroshium TaxID=2010991 RepID=A0A3M2S199_9HYPO|nr:hypothetical protein CDV36_009027 [Fusarium kuroshium]